MGTILVFRVTIDYLVINFGGQKERGYIFVPFVLDNRIKLYDKQFIRLRKDLRIQIRYG